MATLSQPITKTRLPDSALRRFVMRELSPTPDRFNAAVRVTVCAIIITLIGEGARSQELFISLFIALALPRDYPKQTLKASLIIAATVIASGTLALFLQVILADLNWLRVVAIFAAVFFGMLIGRKLNQGLVGVLICVLTVQTMLAYDTTNNSEAVVEGTLWFVMMFLFGVATATAVEYLFPHPTPVRRLTDGIEEQLRAAQIVLKSLSGAPLSDEERRQSSKIDRLAATGVAPLRQLLASVSSARLLPVQDLSRLNALLPFIEMLTTALARLSAYQAHDFDESRRQFAFRLSERVSQLAEWVKNPRVWSDEGNPELISVEERSETRQARLLAQAGDVMDALLNAWYLESKVGVKVQPLNTPPTQNHSFSSQPFFARDNVHFALKVALASIICYVFYNAVDWPGISTSLLTCFIVALDTVGATYRKLALRLAGVAVGGLLFGIGGIALLLSHLDNVVELSLYVAVVFFLSGWVWRGSQRISYAGGQIGLAFALVALAHPTIPNQITEARDRFMGVLLGAIVMWFVFGHLWPVNAIAAQKTKLAELIRDIAELFRSSVDDGPLGKRITRFHELRASANQEILAVYDGMDAYGYDSRHNPELQQSLRTCLANAQALLMLETFAVSSSLVQAADRPALNLHRKQMTDATDNLSNIAEQVKTGGEDELHHASKQLAELLRDSDQNVNDDQAPEQIRIRQQRRLHIVELLGSAGEL